jgi:hypothetical protein
MSLVSSSVENIPNIVIYTLFWRLREGDIYIQIDIYMQIAIVVVNKMMHVIR